MLLLLLSRLLLLLLRSFFPFVLAVAVDGVPVTIITTVVVTYKVTGNGGGDGVVYSDGGDCSSCGGFGRSGVRSGGNNRDAA